MSVEQRGERTVRSSVAIDQPADVVAGLVLDWGHDDLWRPHVRAVTCTPRGRAHEGQRLVEETRFAGRTFVTEAVVTAAGPLSATRTGAGDGFAVRASRVVVPEGEGRCVVHVVTRIRVSGWLRLLAPALLPAYRRSQDADLTRLRWLVGTLHGPEARQAVPV